MLITVTIKIVSCMLIFYKVTVPLRYVLNVILYYV